MRNRVRWVAVAAIAVGAVGAGGAAVASSGATGEDGDTPITGPALERAGAAALTSTGSGKVTDTEVGDEEGYYEVEVTLPSGSEVDVHLTRDFTVIDAQPESGSKSGSE